MRQTKLDNCSVVKMVLMLVIILYHSTVFWKGDWWDSDPFFQSKILGYFAGWLNSFHIYAFSLVSGYIFAYKIERGSYQSYSAFIIKRNLFVWRQPIHQNYLPIKMKESFYQPYHIPGHFTPAKYAVAF